MVSPAPRPSEGQGKRLVRGGLVPSFSGILSAYFVSQSDPVTGTPRGFFVWGGGVLSAPSGRIFHTHVCLFPCPRFFFVAFEARARLGELYAATQRVVFSSENGISNSECYPRIPRNLT